MTGEMTAACPSCLARAWLIDRLASHLELVGESLQPVLALADEELIEAVGGSHRELIRREWLEFDPDAARARSFAADLEIVCRCDPSYPAKLRELDNPPAVLHVAGGFPRWLDFLADDPVAIVGARKASSYGLEMARSLARGLAAAGLTVVSGLALGIDSAAHLGALERGGATIAVMPGSADRAYPPSKRALHRRIRAEGIAVSELGPGSVIWRWTFPARNRLIAALSTMTVVVEAGHRSGALLTASFARALGRPVGAVPGRVTAPLAAGPNRLLASGAHLVTGPEEVLDVLFGEGPRPALHDRRPALEDTEHRLLRALAEAADTTAAFSQTGLDVESGLAVLASLELAGYVYREPGGRYGVVP
jgi:DNA processing protein